MDTITLRQIKLFPDDVPTKKVRVTLALDDCVELIIPELDKRFSLYGNGRITVITSVTPSADPEYDDDYLSIFLTDELSQLIMNSYVVDSTEFIGYLGANQDNRVKCTFTFNDSISNLLLDLEFIH